nr:extensin family protein [Microvirga splendida]
MAVLDGAPLSHTAVPDRDSGDGCGLSNAVEVSRSSVGFNRSFTATCPLTVAWALFERHALLPAAREHLGQEVVRVTHFGTYACRNINHRAGGRRSEHATANAIDIAGFVLADGQQVTVKGDWSGGDGRREAFLRALRDGACRFFDVVLSPDYNEAHHDHFHFDMGSYRACR